MQVIFRADASTHIGSGHVMRCLTLAEELRDNGCEVTFVCRELPGNLISIIEEKGYFVSPLEWQDDSNTFNWQKDVCETINTIESKAEKVDLLIVDHYKIDFKWESKIRDYAKQIMVIDDLADRNHDSDLLLDQNYYCDLESRYEGLVPEYCLKLLGPRYLLLRQEYIEARENLLPRNGEIKQILIFFGSSDIDGHTLTVLRAIESIKLLDINILVVVGASNPNRKEVELYCSGKPNVSFYCQVDNMAELMASVDLAIGAGGASMWERCFLGLPSITVILADNQKKNTEDVDKSGAIKYLGWAHDLLEEDYICAVQWMISNPKKVREMSEKSQLIMTNNTRTGSEIVAYTVLSLREKLPKL
ncbi:MAG: UDP-2,4-diacetamido-2,4,6-trideoxy-beta-L-altropyranose hydrolase [Bacteroidales bacterium]|nr:UDP-2,4-diacetamido-2,4,6-trideoxy-beta-L-altropyranose hydrolase [Bacteroidales bacterium]